MTNAESLDKGIFALRVLAAPVLERPALIRGMAPGRPATGGEKVDPRFAPEIKFCERVLTLCKAVTEAESLTAKWDSLGALLKELRGDVY